MKSSPKTVLFSKDLKDAAKQGFSKINAVVGSLNNEKAQVTTFNNEKGLIGAFAAYQIL